MAAKMQEHNDGTLVDVGRYARVERRFLPKTQESKHPETGEVIRMPVVDDEGNSVYEWVVYEKQSTGIELHANTDKKLLASGGHLDENGIVKPHLVKTPGRHPVLKDKDGNPADTHFEHVWVPVAVVDSKEAALAEAHKIEG